MSSAAVGSVLTREMLNRPSQAASRSTSPSKDDFMQLLVTQMRNQNPLEPVKDAEFLAQLAQFSSVEGIQQLNKSFGEMLLVQQLSQGANLIGKSITYEKTDGTLPGRGTVDAVKVENGVLQLQVEGKSVPISALRTIENNNK